MRITRLLLLPAFVTIFALGSAHAVPVKGKVPSGYSVMAVSAGKADTSDRDAKTFTLDTGASKHRLYLLKNGAVAAPVIAAVKFKGKYYNVAAAKSAKVCLKSGAKLIMGVKGGKSVNAGAIVVKAADGVAYLKSTLAAANLDGSTATTIADKNKCYPAATGASLGLNSAKAKARIAAGTIHLKASTDDVDGDGVTDPLDVDEDGDGVMNAYDKSSPSTPGEPVTLEAHIFSNLKLEVGQSLNLYTTSAGTLSDTDIDNAAKAIGLAMQVAGGAGNTVELDCGALGYCSTGGTGRYQNQPFPDNYDSDADGMGTMTIGPTGDFQLQPQVTAASQIGAGDTYVEVVTDASSTETKVPAMLNFVFRTTPAVKSVSMGGTTTTLTYPTFPSMAGSMNNPIQAPVGWDGKVTIVAYRPQRPGVAGAGEGEYVDIGNSKISIDIPNAPCSTGSPGCSGQGPGNCTPTSYSFTDANLSMDGDTMRDSRGDKDSDFSNPTDALVTFTLDLDACLAARSLTLGSGQKAALDLQLRSDDGDNAAQKFYVSRP